METLAEALELMDRHVARAVEAAQKDRGASPILVAVLLEFQRKLVKTHGSAGADAAVRREAVVELEQAADSAVVAAAADAGAAADTKKLIDIAHGAICMFKAAG
jgi:hypothetical protein